MDPHIPAAGAIWSHIWLGGMQGFSVSNTRRWQWPRLHVKQLAVFLAKGFLRNNYLSISCGCCIAIHVAGR